MREWMIVDLGSEFSIDILETLLLLSDSATSAVLHIELEPYFLLYMDPFFRI